MKNLKMSQTLGKLKFKAMKNSPTIFMVGGVVGVIGACVLACKATLKVPQKLEDHKNIIESVKDEQEDEQINKKLTMVYISTGLDVAKTYAPSIVLGSVSIACIIQSHNILNRRNAALAAAFTTASETFANYRARVVERYGEKIDHELRHNIKTEKVIVTDENGKNKKTEIEVITPPTDYSDYARFYDDGCTGWSKDPEYNLMFLKAQQQYSNDKLVSQGYLFLNDVYDMLGIPRSKEGQIVGWVYDTDAPVGDNYVDFGIYDTNKSNARDFVNGYERTILLDFNVDGNIWDKM